MSDSESPASSVTVFHRGSESKLAQVASGEEYLLQPGFNEIASAEHAQELVKAGHAFLTPSDGDDVQADPGQAPEPDTAPPDEGPHVFSGLTDQTENPLVNEPK